MKSVRSHGMNVPKDAKNLEDAEATSTAPDTRKKAKARLLREVTHLTGSYSGLEQSAGPCEILSVAADGAGRVQRLIQGLLAYSSMGTTATLQLDAAGEEALQRALKNLRGVIDRSGTPVVHEPPGAILAEEMQLIQLFQNLVGNAVEHKTMEEALFVEKERAQVTLNCIGDAVICTDTAGDLTFLNIVAEKLTGWSWQEAAGLPIGKVLRILDAERHDAIADVVKVALAQDRAVRLPSNCILIRRDGAEIPIEDSVAPINDRAGRATGVVIVFRDVSAARAIAKQIAHSAQHDFLTGLPNRLLLSDRIHHAITLARRHTKQAAVLFMDLDGFKHINDSLGHPIGDKLLQSIAKRLTACMREADTVSRQGGDEFVVLLSELARPEDAAIAAKKLLGAVALPHSIAEHQLHVTASIGVSVYPDDGLDADTLLKSADTAMYQAKENGRQGFQFFKPAMYVRAVERQLIETNLRLALERREFALQFQPKIDLTTGGIVGAEALLRWTHPSQGPVSPAQFIPIAEECGLILPIGNWVLRAACAQAKAWADAGLPATTMAVNVSAMEFRDAGFLEGLFAILDETGLNPEALELELTESVLMKSPEYVAAVLENLREKGVRVAMDDFGTGFSSLSYLRKLPLDTLKIDQSFVRQMTTSQGDASIVTAVIDMARGLNLRVVAEGVETVEQQAFLVARQCDEAQGYYFSKPVPGPQFARLLETGMTGVVTPPAAATGATPAWASAG